MEALAARDCAHVVTLPVAHELPPQVGRQRKERRRVDSPAAGAEVALRVDVGRRELRRDVLGRKRWARGGGRACPGCR